MKHTTPNETDLEAARRWWPDLRNIWTPIGWKNHLFRFNVLWNGVILAQPHLNRRTEQWKNQGAQFSFVPWWGKDYPPPFKRLSYQFIDDNSVRQGWNDCPAPVLWSEWSDPAGLVLRQEVFAHVPGALDVRTGIEPLFAWVRISIHDTCPALPLEKEHGILIKINAPYAATSMNAWRNLTLEPEKSRYPRHLAAEPASYSPRSGMRVIEKGGKVLLAVAPHQKCSASFHDKIPTDMDSHLHLRFAARKGAHVDILVPMLPMDRQTIEKEMATGFDAALKEANRYWSRKPATAATVFTPEQGVNDTIRHSLKFAEVIAEKNPANGQYSLLSGSLAYASLWATPFSMCAIMLLDTLGLHDVLEKHLEIFRAEQGTVKPPGDHFRKHPGYLSSPKTLTSIDWLSDHGAILYTICKHALLTGDRSFTDRWLSTIVRACEFVKDARAIRGHGGYVGIMPPAVASDCCTKIQAVWNDGWIYKGYSTAIRLLKEIGHPRADEFATDARAYKTTFQRAFRDKSRKMPVWTDRRGKRHPLVPTSLFGDTPQETRGAFYLDVGPLFLVHSGLMDARDELMRSTLLWFREGPQTKFFREDSCCWQIPCLRHEISSCEPCYSWNIFHPHQSGNREKFLEGMYSLFAGAISQKTFISCETRHGITGNVFAAPLAIYLARLAMIDETLKAGEMHLLRFVPLAWLRPGLQTRFDNMPTEYGPVTLRVQLSKDERTLQVVWKPRFRIKPERVLLHVPPLAGLKGVRVNGRRRTMKKIIVMEGG